MRLRGFGRASPHRDFGMSSVMVSRLNPPLGFPVDIGIEGEVVVNFNSVGGNCANGRYPKS